MSQSIVIIGAGQAAAQAVTTLRAEGFAGPLCMIGGERFPPYQRPPLSKAYLAGTFERERLFLKPQEFYADAGCDLILGVTAAAIDRSARAVTLDDGRRVDYDRLLIATGSRVRRLPVPGADLPGIFHLRDIVDVDSLREAFAGGGRLAVVGGGYIGLEVAAVAMKHGLSVTVFESLDRVMARAVSPELSAFYEKMHRQAGVGLEMDTTVELFEGTDRLSSIRAGEKSYPADFALVGIGIVPNVELAQAAGLYCDDGIVVDECARTADTAICAAGDCTRHIARDGTPVRLESVQNAIDQAKHAALAMLDRPVPYREVPWFWSDQYDVKLQIAGLARESDVRVLRGNPATRKFAVFHLRDGCMAAVEAVNAAPEYIVGRKLIAGSVAVDPAKLADTTMPMKSLA
jgi:3-phenylpropionate/trans-cinnamate dioxygenase ferredoxin reductase subunit